jgi:hypothetical protein
MIIFERSMESCVNASPIINMRHSNAYISVQTRMDKFDYDE